MYVFYGCVLLVGCIYVSNIYSERANCTFDNSYKRQHRHSFSFLFCSFHYLMHIRDNIIFMENYVNHFVLPYCVPSTFSMVYHVIDCVKHAMTELLETKTFSEYQVTAEIKNKWVASIKRTYWTYYGHSMIKLPYPPNRIPRFYT